MIFLGTDKRNKASLFSNIEEQVKNYNFTSISNSLSLINNAENDKAKIRVFRDFRVTDKR